MVVHGVVALLFLLETEGLHLVGCDQLQPAVDFVELVGDLEVHSEVLGIVLHSLLLLFGLRLFYFVYRLFLLLLHLYSLLLFYLRTGSALRWSCFLIAQKFVVDLLVFLVLLVIAHLILLKLL